MNPVIAQILILLAVMLGSIFKIQFDLHCSTDDVLLVSNPYVYPEYNLYFTAVVRMVQL